MWLDWLKDEIMLQAETGLEGHQYIVSLFERALKDYKYFKVCKLYCQYMVDKFEQKLANIVEVQDVFEQSLQVWGLDFYKSHKLWEPFLKFELAQPLSEETRRKI